MGCYVLLQSKIISHVLLRSFDCSLTSDLKQSGSSFAIGWLKPLIRNGFVALNGVTMSRVDEI